MMNDKPIRFSIVKNSKILQTDIYRIFFAVEPCLGVDFSCVDVKLKGG